MKTDPRGLRRREFIALLGAGALGAAPGKPLRGIFPIAQTPFTDANRLDLNALAAEVKFVDRGGVHGFVWPQMASEYTTLSESERLAGAEAIAATGKSLRPAIVIGVQGSDLQSALRYARHAEKIGADALISLPPASGSPDAVLQYYREIGNATHLPLFLQSTGQMSVEEIVRISRATPALTYVKDEAGPSPLPRIGELKQQSGGRLTVFTGNHGVTLIDEMQRGSSGSMPAASFADLYAAVWDGWQAGKRNEAMDLFGRTLLLISEVQAYGIQALKYILRVRGVFPNDALRLKDTRVPLDGSGKRALREMLDFLKPWLRA
jgi:dihydrodipicolinate synthase/N-acetylneuraminate lyase